MSKHLRTIFIITFFTLFFCSCGSRSLEDFREEGEAISTLLVKELNRVHTRDQLLQSSPKLKQLFGSLVDVIIAAHEYREHQDSIETLEFSSQSLYVSECLRAELNRVYQVEGARSIVEKCQEHALHRLDGYKKKKALTAALR
jgi:hypothetical protein